MESSNSFSPFRSLRKKVGPASGLRDPYGYRSQSNPSHRLSPNASSVIQNIEQGLSQSVDELKSYENDDGDDEKTEDGDDDDRASDLSSLVGVAIAAARDAPIASMASSASLTSSALEYSTDDCSFLATAADSVSVSSVSSSQGKRRRPKASAGTVAPTTPVHYYNPQTIHTGTFLLSVLGSSSSSRSASDLESNATLESDDEVSTSDRYFTDPLDILSRTLPEEHTGFLSSDEQCYIFTDDEEDLCVLGSANSRSGDGANAACAIPTDDAAVAVASDLSRLSPNMWAQYNQNRGRLVAQQMLQPYFNQLEEGDTDPLSDEDDGNQTDNRRRPSLLGRVFRTTQQMKLPMYPNLKRFTQSTSALDHPFAANRAKDTNVLTVNPVTKHRVSDLACLAIADAERASTDQTFLCMSSTDSFQDRSSAVLTRNALVDFSAWEAVLRANEPSQNSSVAIPTRTARESQTSDAALEEASHSSVDDEMDDDTSVLFIKSVSMLVQDFVFGKTTSTRQGVDSMSASVWDEVDLYSDANDDFYRRRTSEDVATALGISSDGHHLLQHVRGRAGIIDDLLDDGSSEPTLDSSNGNLPWIHLFGDVWMPHYEEYVVRAVHAFSRLLLTSPRG